MDRNALTAFGSFTAVAGFVGVARVGLLLAALLLASCRSYPAGRSERPIAQGEIQAYWVLRGDEANAEMLVERLYLPTSLAVLTWTKFSVTNEGVQLESQGGYRVVSRRETLREPVGDLIVHGDQLSIRLTSAAPVPSGRPRAYEIDFSYAGLEAASSRVIPQPLQEALLRGIRESGRRSGQARLVSLSYLGGGRFAATVEVI
jgi:hypothetical protein